MKAKFLTPIGTALALAMIGSNALAQSITVPKEIKLSQASGGSRQSPTQPAPGSANQQAPARQSAPPSQSPSQPQNQPAPQAEVSQEELQKFANAVKKLQPLQKEALSQITQVIQQQKLSEKRFGEIYQARQNPQAQPTPKISPEENKRFEQANAKIEQIQQATQSRMEQTVRSEGLEIPQFNRIFAAIRQNPALMQKIQQMIQSPS